MMRLSFYLLILSCCISTSVLAQAPTLEFQHFSMGSSSDNIFTSNNFKAIAVGKGGVIWAGTQYGGLYMYSTTNHVWTKSDKLTNVSINDIKSDPDSGIWIGQSGTSGGGTATNIAGGVNYFPLATDAVMNFYSVPGTTTGAYLQSRNVRSIYLDTAFKAADGELPRIWVASSTYKSAGNVIKGGVNVGLNAVPPSDGFFDRLLAGLGLQSNLICESVGGNSAEIWVGTRYNGIGTAESRIVRYTPGKGFIDATYDANNTPTFQAGFSAQAIFFSSDRSKWVGLKQGGLRILSLDGRWYAMNGVQYFDAGTQVNYNAIAEDEFGNVYIGTSGGLLIYESPRYATGSASPDASSSYKLLTTAQGLLDNNVTGIAYDKENGKILITSAGGVSFLKIKYPNIHGVVQNVYTDAENEKVAGLQRKAFPVPSAIKVYLMKNGVEEEMVNPAGDGSFELKKADETSTYTVEVKYINAGKTMRYIYNGVKKHTRIETTLLPDSLIGEIEKIIPKLKTRCFPMKLTFGFEVPDLICTKVGFFTNNYQTSYDWVYDPGGVSTDHRKHVDNLANCYAGLAAVYNIGGQSADLINEAAGSLCDAIESIIGEFKAKKAVKLADEGDVFANAGEDAAQDALDAAATIATNFAEGLVYLLNKSLVYVEDKDKKDALAKLISAVSEGANLAIELGKSGRGDAAMKAVKDNIKRTIAQYLASAYYDNSYAQDRHARFVPQISQAAHNLKSTVSYEEAYERLYSTTTPSLVQQSTDLVKADKEIMTTLVNVSKFADAVNAMSDLVTTLGLLPGGQAIAAAARVVAIASKAFKYFALAGAVYVGVDGAVEVAKFSDEIQKKTALERMEKNLHTSYSNLRVQTSTDSLMARKNRYNQKLTELQPIYAAGSFDLNAFKIKRSQLKFEDSLYSAELKNVMNSIVSVADTAGQAIANFRERYEHVVDTFINYRAVLKKAYYYRNMAYIFESNKNLDKGAVDSLIVALKVTNDSIVNGFQNLLADINSNNILARAFLLQEKYAINFSRTPGATGSVTYSFKNYGGEPQNNVSFKITDIEKGYTALGADSVNVGTILAGQTKSVTFNFKAPMHDSISHYRIAVKADNGRFQDATGSFYAIDPGKCFSLKDGNWNDPSVWSCNQVPTASNPVYLIHNIIVTAPAACKNIVVSTPGLLKVNTGIAFTVIE